MRTKKLTSLDAKRYSVLWYSVANEPVYQFVDEVVDEVTQDVSYDLTLDRDFLRHGKLDCDVNIGRDECVKISRWERIHYARWQGTRLTPSPTHLLSLTKKLED